MRINDYFKKLWKFLNSVSGTLGVLPSVLGFIGALTKAFPTQEANLSAVWATILSLFAFFITLELLKKRKWGLKVSTLFIILSIIMGGVYWLTFHLPLISDLVPLVITTGYGTGTTLEDMIAMEQKKHKMTFIRLVWEYSLALEYAILFVLLTVGFTILGHHRHLGQEDNKLS